MLAITKDSAYKICAINADSDFNCYNDCDLNSNTHLYISSSDKNVCSERYCHWDGLFSLKPEDICTNDCNENYYIKKYTYSECWLCKDLNEKYPYKLINRKECLQQKPNNSYFINENLFLVACNEGFKFFENGNCIEKCSEGYFSNNKIVKNVKNLVKLKIRKKIIAQVVMQVNI